MNWVKWKEKANLWKIETTGLNINLDAWKDYKIHKKILNLKIGVFWEVRWHVVESLQLKTTFWESIASKSMQWRLQIKKTHNKK